MHSVLDILKYKSLLSQYALMISSVYWHYQFHLIRVIWFGRMVIICCMVIYFLRWYWKEFLLKSITFPVQCRIFWFNCHLCTFYFSGKYDIIVGGNLVGNYDSKGSFGELALMYNMPRAATIVATSEGTLWGMV
jgi:hypothetical protein